MIATAQAARSCNGPDMTEEEFRVALPTFAKLPDMTGNFTLTCAINLTMQDWQIIQRFVESDPQWSGCSIDTAVTLLAQSGAIRWNYRGACERRARSQTRGTSVRG